MNITHQPQEIRQYVRRLPEEEQPDFAAVLESIGQRSSCRICYLLQDPPNGTRSSAGLFSPAPSPDRELKSGVTISPDSGHRNGIPFR